MPRHADLEITLGVAAILDELEVDYLVAGSVASSLLGVPRATLDVDLVADLREHHVALFVERLGSDFYAPLEAIEMAVQERTSFSIIHRPIMLKLDVFLLKPDPLARLEMKRRVSLPLPGDPPAQLQVATAEDTILQKLRWYRLGDETSERQWTDVLGVLRIQDERLDRQYLEKWAESLGITDLLFRAMERAKRT